MATILAMYFWMREKRQTSTLSLTDLPLAFGSFSALRMLIFSSPERDLRGEGAFPMVATFLKKPSAVQRKLQVVDGVEVRLQSPRATLLAVSEGR
eukprot:scaffold2720_cov212-Pinguiococcus_pyrenoidosus.AAC.5